MTIGMTYYFYDLETSGINVKNQRIFQFAGQRVDENLEPIGEPHNLLIKATDDILPEPSAVMITGITPQATLQDGLTEYEFLEIFNREISTPNTCFAGFNTIRFDDEFIRHLLYRNFNDPYEWQWKDGRCRWDMMDVLRMTRALRPEGIQWPHAEDGMAVNRLEKVAEANGLIHDQAHDALSDVTATIAVAKLLQKSQPKLWDYLKSNISKSSVVDMLGKARQTGTPLVHTSSKLEMKHLKTSIVFPLFENNQGVTFAYDLRYDPDELKDLDEEELKRRAFSSNEELGETVRLPVKGIHHNRAPALAPLGVLDEGAELRIELTKNQAIVNLGKLKQLPELVERIRKITLAHVYDANQIVTAVPTRASASGDVSDTFVSPILVDDVDGQLYDGFISNAERAACKELTALKASDLKIYEHVFSDNRLNALLPLYKARNFPTSLTDSDRDAWTKHCQARLTTGAERSRLSCYLKEIEALGRGDITSTRKYLLEELLLWGQNLVCTKPQLSRHLRMR
jgi:exodeoxyribonuclease I